LPFLWSLYKTAQFPKRYLWIFPILLAGIFFSYTRAAQASVILLVVFYLIVQWKLVKYAVALTLVLAIAFISFITTDNKYIDFAPDFEKTITHKKFDNLLEATTKMQDISTVERFYRWIAGAYMVGERPLLGFGPGSFYSNYKPYTVTSYKTYISDNPERSGIHNNYLMVTVEQGVIGLLIMMGIVLLPLFYCEQLFHRATDGRDKQLIIAAGACIFITAVTILINELLEEDKIGPLFFYSMAILTYFSNKYSKA